MNNMDSFIYIDPNFNDRVGHYLTWRNNLLKECRHRGIHFSHYVRRDIQYQMVENYHLLRLFPFKSSFRNISFWRQLKVTWFYQKNFEHILKKVASQKEIHHFSQIYFYTTHPILLKAICRAVQAVRIPKTKLNINLVLFYLNNNFLTGEYSPAYSKLLKQLSNTLERADKENTIRLYMDSTNGIRAYQPYFKRTINTLPMPVHYKSVQFSEKRCHTKDFYTVGYFGYATKKHGFDRLIQFFQDLESSQTFQNNKFIIKISTDIVEPGFHEPLQEFIQKWKNHQNITLITKNLENEKYQALLRESDIALIPYRREFYYAQTSSVFIDAIINKTIPIVEANSWMADQLKHLGCGETFETSQEKDLYHEYQKIIDNYQYYADRFPNDLDGFMSQFTTRSLFDQLFGIYDPVSFSVITPSLNQAEFLPDCIQSVAEQTIPPVEHLIYDPGSSDSSRDVVLNHSKELPYLRLFSEEDSGQADAVNKGIQDASGDIIAWLNADDSYYDNTVFENVARCFQSKYQPDIVYGTGVYIDEKGNTIKAAHINQNPDSLCEQLQKKVGILQPSVFIRKKSIAKIGLLDIDLNFCMDYEYWIRAAQYGLKFHFLPMRLSKARYYPTNKTLGRRGDSYREILDMLKENFGYIHIDWLKRFAEFLADRFDGVLKNSSNTQMKNPQLYNESLTDLIKNYSCSHMTLSLFEANQDNRPMCETYDSMKNLRIPIKAHCRVAPERDSSDGRSNKNRRKIKSITSRLSRFLSLNPMKKMNIFKHYKVGDRTFEFAGNWLETELAKGQHRLGCLKSKRVRDTCIIVGNGPSLNKTNLSLLQGEDVYISNHAYLSAELLNNAKFYSVVNYLVAEQSYWRINALRDVQKIFPYWLSYCLRVDENTSFVKSVGREEFSTNIAENVSWRSTVSFFMLQIAYYLGYRKVILIGFDHNFEQPPQVREGEILVQNSDDPNHFAPRYFKGKKWQAADTHSMEKLYLLAKQAYEENNREIINATVGGKLEIFRRDQLENLVPSKSNNSVKAFVKSSPNNGLHIKLEMANKFFSQNQHVDEVEIAHSFLRQNHNSKTMFDIGAHHGGSLWRFVQDGWAVFAFEPDKQNHKMLKKRFKKHKNLTIEKYAVSDKMAKSVPFFRSEESSGISSLNAFHHTHEFKQKVNIITLISYCQKKNINAIDFLKIDTEGSDYFVLREFPWDKIKPNLIICEFEDRKTLPLGYSYIDMAKFLTKKGYRIIVSEWEPILKYGVKHKWRKFNRFPCELTDRAAWGNFIALHCKFDLELLLDSYHFQSPIST